MVAVAVAIAGIAAVLLLIRGLGEDFENPAFPSARDPEAPATIWAVGDGGVGGSTARAIAEMIADDDPERMLYLGDVYDDGTAEEFRENYDEVYRELSDITAPTPGDHEWPTRDEGYFPYWSEKTGEDTPPWYTFRIGGWRIISLNSEAPHGPGSPQLQWLQSLLEAESGTCVLAFWHRPAASAGKHGDQEDVEPLWDALRGQATAVLGANDHGMQRFEPRDGIVQFISGSGGKELYDVDSSDSRLEFQDDDNFGALRIELRPGGASTSFITKEGAVVDRSSLKCTPSSS